MIHILGLQTGQHMHVVIRAADAPSAIAEFDTDADGFARLVDAFDKQHVSIQVTHVDPQEVMR